MLARMAETPEPAPRKFAFKPNEFERVNDPRPEAGAETAAPPAANDVFALRQEIREREIAAGMDNLKPADRPRSNKRRRDFWLMLVGGNLAIAGTGAIVGFNVMTAVYVFAGVILYTLGLTWVMWVVVDRY
jgi:hypothetical protein